MYEEFQVLPRVSHRCSDGTGAASAPGSSPPSSFCFSRASSSWVTHPGPLSGGTCIQTPLWGPHRGSAAGWEGGRCCSTRQRVWGTAPCWTPQGSEAGKSASSSKTCGHTTYPPGPASTALPQETQRRRPNALPRWAQDRGPQPPTTSRSRVSKVAQRSLPSQNQAERDGERENDIGQRRQTGMTVAHVTWRQWLDSLILGHSPRTFATQTRSTPSTLWGVA